MADEMRALTRLAIAEVREATGGIGAVHRAIADRAFAGGGAPKAMHDAIAGGVYAAVRGGASLAGAVADRALARREPGVAPPAVVAVINGLRGDALEREGSTLAVPMTAHGGEGSPRVAVFVHGLFENELAWRYGGGPTYGERLAADQGLEPVYVRFNSGRHVSENGRSLADLLADWPVPLEQVVLVGHSMGGLVARSACHYAQAAEARWPEAVRHVFCLGSPHLGADLEKAANVLGSALARLPEMRGLAKVVNGRSVGIKDLRFGSCAEEDWCDCEPDEFLKDRCREVPFLDTAAYYFVGATISAGPVGTVLGDLLVRLPSASGHGKNRSVPFALDRGRHLTGLTHFDLLNHPAVYEQLRTWMD